jgi:hypothetical protein
MLNDNFYLYSTYGLNFRSSIKLPGLVERTCREGIRIDVEIFFQKITASVLNKYFGDTPVYKTPGCDVRASEQAMCFAYAKTGTILVAGGNKVMLDLRFDAQEEDIVPYLTGYVLSILLHQRNYLVLHASVVMVESKGVAFLGAKGCGKSTLAASLQVKGHRLISDDHLPIVFKGDEIVALPGYPQIKLYADSVEAVGGDPSQLSPVHRRVSKYSFSDAKKFSNEMIRLSGIYVLNIDDNISLKRLGQREAFIEATKHTHLSHYLKESNSRERHFEHCCKLVQAIPFFQLSRPHDFEKMDQVTELVESHSYSA